MRECSEITRHSRWADVKKYIDGDKRYRAVESSILREDYFHDYCKILKDEKRKQKEKDRERKEKKEKSEKSDKCRDSSRREKGKDIKSKENTNKDEDKSSRNGSDKEDQVRTTNSYSL